jgi:hypothetical protein
MRRGTRRPGDQPLPRPALAPGVATKVYRLGRQAAERELARLREQLAELRTGRQNVACQDPIPASWDALVAPGAAGQAPARCADERR